MTKTYAEIAMDIIRDDWDRRKFEKGTYYTQAKVAELMGISRTGFAKALTLDKDPTISFICGYAVAVGMDVREMLTMIGDRISDEQRSAVIKINANMLPEWKSSTMKEATRPRKTRVQPLSLPAQKPEKTALNKAEMTSKQTKESE